MIINGRHENVIQYREGTLSVFEFINVKMKYKALDTKEISLKTDPAIIFPGWCNPDRTSLEEMCTLITSDDTLYSMFRVNSKPISCPFSGASFTFTYNRGYAECVMPVSLAEKCTDESKLLLKYQACPDVAGTESNSKLIIVKVLSAFDLPYV